MKDVPSHTALYRACNGADAKHAQVTVCTRIAQHLAFRPLNS